MSDSDDEPLARRGSFTEDSDSNDDNVSNTNQIFLPDKYIVNSPCFNGCIQKEPAIKGHHRGLVRGRHDDSIDSPMVICT